LLVFYATVKRAKPNRHSEPSVNHGEESQCWITKQVSIQHEVEGDPSA